MNKSKSPPTTIRLVCFTAPTKFKTELHLQYIKVYFLRWIFFSAVVVLLGTLDIPLKTTIQFFSGLNPKRGNKSVEKKSVNNNKSLARKMCNDFDYFLHCFLE